MDTRIDLWRTARFIALGFCSGVMSVIITNGLGRLWPNPVVYLVVLFGMLVAPFVFCGIYPLWLLIATRTWQAAAIFVMSLVIGFLSAFTGAIVTTGIAMLANNYLVRIAFAMRG